MKIVVTGGSGLLGVQVVRELTSAGHEVLSVDRRPHPEGYRPSWTAELTAAGNLFEACAHADALVHLAAIIAPGLASDCDTFNVNATLAYNALKAASEIRLKRAVIASSTAAYGFLYGSGHDCPDYLPIDEEHARRPADVYGLSKVVGEMVADSFARGTELSIASLRFPGINFDPSFKRIRDRFDNPGIRKTGFWSYIDARDAALACRLAVEADLAGHRAYNVAAPRSNMKEPTEALIRRFWPQVKDVRRREAGNWSGIDSSRAERELGFQAQHVWERYVAA